MQPTPPPRTSLRIIAALALVAVLSASYLLYQSLSGNFDTCCGSVLETRWAKWFGIPVSALALAVYAPIVAIALLAVRSPVAARALPVAALLAGGAAVWFFVVLLFIEKATCLYCIITHLCGLSIAGLVFSMRRKLPAASLGQLATAGCALVAMIAGQTIAGDRDLKFDTADSGTSSTKTRPTGSTIAFSDQIQLRLGDFPMVGSEKAPHFIAEIFDYTCKSCRDTYGDIKALEKAHPGAVTVIYLPAPLNRRCNTYLPSRVDDHKDACELSRIALAVWAADPQKFPEYHDSLMTRPLPIAPADAEAKAISLVGKDAFQKARRSPAIERLLQTALGYYASTVAGGDIKMPKVLIGAGQLMHGSAPSTAAFVNGMGKKFGLQ